MFFFYFLISLFCFVILVGFVFWKTEHFFMFNFTKKLKIDKEQTLPSHPHMIPANSSDISITLSEHLFKLSHDAFTDAWSDP